MPSGVENPLSLSAGHRPVKNKTQRTPKRWLLRLGALLALLAGVGLAFAAFAVLGLQLALRLREVPVPDLSGQTVDEAAQALSDIQLRIRLEALSQIHPTIPAGHISSQDPASGLRTRSQRSVKVWLSSGPSAESVPSLIGETVAGARSRLEEDALGFRGISEIRSARYASEAIVGQDPPAEAAAPDVSVLINRGERGVTYVMPDLIGVYESSAADLLRTRGFRVTVVGSHPYPGVEEGVVLRQFPRAGFQIAHGEAISLEISQ